MRGIGFPERLFLFLILTWLVCIPAIAQSSKSEPGDESTKPVQENPSSDENAPGISLPSDVLTRESFEKEAPEKKEVGLTAYESLRVLFSLALVVGLIWGLSVLLKRFITVKGLASSSESVKVLYSLSLTPTRTLYLVRLSNRILLIGAGEGGLRTLSEITDREEVSTILRELEFKGNFDLNPFKEKLAGLIGSQETDSDKEDLESSRRRLEGALDRLKKSGDD
ncbi:MAG: flagellar biosynthetic protein FliO [bacterium]